MECLNILVNIWLNLKIKFDLKNFIFLIALNKKILYNSNRRVDENMKKIANSKIGGGAFKK